MAVADDCSRLATLAVWELTKCHSTRCFQFQSLKWNEHAANVCSKLNKWRLYFIKQLKWAGMSTCDLLYFYISVIRCADLHGRSVKRSSCIRSFQKRALKIICNDFTSGDNAYIFNCIRADFPQVAETEQLTRHLLSRWQTLVTAWTIYHLLSVTEINSSLSSAEEYPLLCAKTTWF